jgi:hypothetical protein
MSASERFGDDIPLWFEGTAYVDAIGDAPNGKDYRLTIDHETIGRANAGDFMARKRVYHDNFMRLTKSELKNIDLSGLPVCLEHGGRIGTIINSYVDGNDRLCIVGHVTESESKRMMRDGKLNNLSIKYNRDADAMGRKCGLKVLEVSAVKEPFFSGCTINVVASKRYVGANKLPALYRNVHRSVSHQKRLPVFPHAAKCPRRPPPTPSTAVLPCSSSRCLPSSSAVPCSSKCPPNSSRCSSSLSSSS